MSSSLLATNHDADAEDDDCFSDNLFRYEITITTGSGVKAGTLANVSIIITGTDGRTTGNLELRAPNSTNLFQRNSIDFFRVTAADVGRVSIGISYTTLKECTNLYNGGGLSGTS